MKKKYLAIVMVVIFTLLCSSCFGPGMNDWHYDLPNGYEIVHVSSHNIICVNRNQTGNTTIVDAQVSEFCFNDRYVGLKRVDVYDIHEEIDYSNPVYYLVDTLKGRVYGALSEEEYISRIDYFDVENMCEWMATKPAPEGAVFPEF